MGQSKELEELLEAYNKLEKECMQIKKKLEEVQGENQKGTIWQPKIGEKYWIAHRDEISYITNANDAYDQEVMFYGTCYPTEEKAKFETNREKYTRLFRQYVEQHSEPLDWKHNSQEKWHCYYNFFSRKIEIDYAWSFKYSFDIYASSKEILQEALDFIGEDNFKRYILEVEE